jgi:sec-independent protein translocase protein TatA
MGLDNPLHIAFLLVILLLVFGAKRLPEMGRSLGEGLRGFKTSIEGGATPPGLAAPVAAPAQSVVAGVSPQVAHQPAEAVAAGQPQSASPPRHAESAPAQQPQEARAPRPEIVPTLVAHS